MTRIQIYQKLKTNQSMFYRFQGSEFFSTFTIRKNGKIIDSEGTVRNDYIVDFNNLKRDFKAYQKYLKYRKIEQQKWMIENHPPYSKAKNKVVG